jgi:hypothetical protein
MLSAGRGRHDTRTSRIVSSAEDFLERRDRIFADQLRALKGQAALPVDAAGPRPDPAAVYGGGDPAGGGPGDRGAESAAGGEGPGSLAFTVDSEGISRLLALIRDQARALEAAPGGGRAAPLAPPEDPPE